MISQTDTKIIRKILATRRHKATTLKALETMKTMSEHLKSELDNAVASWDEEVATLKRVNVITEEMIREVQDNE